MMPAQTNLLPLKLMMDRIEKSKEDSDTSYFYDLMLLGELFVKFTVCSLISGINDDKDRNRYRLLHKIVRADGVGEWSATLDEILTGVPAQFLQSSIILNEQKELLAKSEIGAWQYNSIQALVSIFPIVQLEKVNLPSKIVGRQWFAYFSQLRNGTKAHGALTASECSMACQYLANSLFLIIENFSLLKREFAFLYQNMNGRYRVTKLNENITHFEDLKVSNKYSSLYQNGIYVFLDRITQVELIYSTPEAADFYLPNGNFKASNFEMLSYITNSRSKGNGSLYMTPAGQLPNSETQGLGNLEVQGKCFGNIPPLSNDYIKRNTLEVDLLNILLQEDRYPIVTLLGSGGIGKTTLALSVLHELINYDRYECIMWFSSRDIDLKPDGPKHVKNSILSEQDLADEYVKLVDNRELMKSTDRLSFFSKELVKSSYGKTLFVLDNFETVVNPAELFKWIDTYVRNPNKVLITSRISKNFKADYPVEVQGMNYEEGLELINKTAQSLSILSMLSEEVKERIFDEAKGHPYVMKILLGQMAKEKKFSSVDRIMASQEEILVALFRRTFTSLSPTAKRVFLTLCSWRSVIPIIALEAVMLREEIKDRINVDDAIEELKRSSFIDITRSEKDFSSFVTVPLAAQLFGRGELEVSPMKVAILSDKELLLEFGAIQQSDIYNGLKPRIERKFRTVANRVLNDGESLSTHLPTLEYLCRKFPFAWNFLYELYIERGCYKEAEEALREYLKTTLSVEERHEILDKLASLYKFEKDYFAEVSTRIDICLLPNTSLDEVSEISNVVNNYLFSDEFYPAKLELDDEIKQSLIRRLTDIFKEKINGGFTVTATDYSRLAWLYMHLQDMEAAEKIVEKGLAKDFSNTYIRKLSRKLGLY